MTYIYGRTEGSEGRLFADSLLTLKNRNSDPMDPMQHSLKIHVIDRNNAIGVAGLFAPGVDSVVDFSNFPMEMKCARDSHLYLAEALQKRCKRHDFNISECELIYLRKIAEKAELFIIRDGLPKAFTEGFIGDTDFHQSFTTTLREMPNVIESSNPTVSEFTRENSKILTALSRTSRVNYNTISPLEGDHWIRVATNDKRGFVYLASAASGVVGGIGGMTSLFHIDKPKPGVAIFIEDRRCGYIYYTGSTDFPEEVRGANFHDFSIAVKIRCDELSKTL